MKTMRLAQFITMLALLSFSCGSPDKTEESNREATQEVSEEPENSQTVNTAALLDHYVKLKNALVESDAGTAASAAVALADETAATGEIHDAARAIAQTEDIAIQRQYFYDLSNAMYQVVKQDKNLGKTVYWQYCPMARDNQGANWLSMESEILNPYFGDAMLTCGAVEEEL